MLASASTVTVTTARTIANANTGRKDLTESGSLSATRNKGCVMTFFTASFTPILTCFQLDSVLATFHKDFHE